MNLPYLVPRVVRHFMPEGLTRFLLLRSIIIRPGLETTAPQTAANRYNEILKSRGDSLKDKRVLVFGYGGRFDLGIGLLEAGAEHVVLCDKYAPPDDAHNAMLLSKYDSVLFLDGGRTRPRPERMTLLQADIRDIRSSPEFPPVDLVVSSSVYEHLDDVDGITRSLASLTKPGGLHIHYVDLRDHFFKYPFEMLSYSETIWRSWLNPTSNHNRFRLWDYRRAFEKYFEKIEIQILERDETAFEKARPRIRSEFVSGNLQDDSVTLILVIASRPRN
ncbi:MAG: methyltransferase domain-containing protein [Chloroflexi bacterium]|nr:methyltransferase domain-containing protein [Chloroflexota bacterium]